MKSVVNIFTQISVIFGILILPALVFAQGPSLPHQFFGSVNFTNSAAPDGLTVEAKKIDGAVIGSSVTKDGKYGYKPNLLFATDNTGNQEAYTGEVEFYVDGIKANETVDFEKGNSSEVDLTISSTPTSGGNGSSGDSGSNGSSGSSGGGSISGGSSTNSGDNEDTTKCTGDISEDNKVDILDFNLLIVNWGDNPGNKKADLDKNNRVDILDFNTLIVNWTEV